MARDTQKIWDSAKLGRRVQLVQSAGWVNRKGQLTKTGEKIAASKWEKLSPAARAVITRQIAKLYK